MKKISYLFFITSVIVTLLAFIEVVCFFALPDLSRQPLFYQTTKEPTFFDNLTGVGFDFIDPLCGWRMSDSLLKSKGFETENGNIVLQTKKKAKKPFIIYISGGSTTDPATISYNWPLNLIQLLDSAGISSKIVIGAVGGYNSGQELLKLLNDDFELMPDVHLSYSGANEIEPAYISYFEQEYFQYTSDPPGSRLLPNTVCYLKKKLNTYNGFSFKIRNHFSHLVNVYPNGDATQYTSFVNTFWLKNMKAMHAVAIANNYHFLGILQPLQGGSAYTQANSAPYAPVMIKQYKKYYPALIKTAEAHPEFIVNFCSIFDTVKGAVYTDDCHPKAEYQNIVAKNVFELLQNKNMLPATLPTAVN